MNTYKIIFTRENGTQGTDHFTAINERQARKDFGECYRHSTATARWNGQRYDEEATAAGEAQHRAEAAEAEVIQLKAKLYDLLVAGK